MHQYTAGDEPVPGYRLTRFLGKGGFGQVWEASAPGGVFVALKIISLEGSEGLKEFRAVGLVKKLHDPNLIPLHGYWLKDSFGNLLDAANRGDSINLRGKSKELIIAMGLGEKNLAQRLDECKKAGLPGIPVEELIDHMTDAGRAIDYLNEPKHLFGTKEPIAIQHCDIKPANLLIVGKGIQVCDYGLARALTNDVRATQGAGTPAYCAPEMFRNNPSSKTDQYSLAITYYELRTGQLPFDEREAINAHILGNLDLSLVPPAERDVLRKATHIRPDNRYPSTMDMVRALRDAACQRVPVSQQRTSLVPDSVSRPVSPTSLDELIRGGNELVPHYKLVKLLGRGGYGEVWEARGPGGKHCALKIVRGLEAGQGRQEFRSLDLIRDLDHDRLISLQAYWLLDKTGAVIHDDQSGQPNAPIACVLVMATDLAAKNLLNRWQEYANQGEPGIPAPELLRYTRQAAEAIDYLNAHAIQHRDIKPENILLTRDGRVKVSDFGLAKLVEGTQAMVHSASVGLTAAYAAPELFGNTVTRWTDQYSLALTYYKLRTGLWPFPADSGPFQMMQAHALGKLEFAGVTEAEKQALTRATTLEPSGRYNSCQEMAEELALALGISGVTTTSTASTPLLPSPSSLGSDASISNDTAIVAPQASGAISTDTVAYVPPAAVAPAPATAPRPMAAKLGELQPTFIPGTTPSGTLEFTDASPRAVRPLPRTALVETDPALPMTRPTPASIPATAKDWQQTQRKSGNGAMIVVFVLLLVGLLGGGGYFVVKYVIGDDGHAQGGSSNSGTGTGRTNVTSGSGSTGSPIAAPDPRRTNAESLIKQFVDKGEYAQAAQAIKDNLSNNVGDASWANEQNNTVRSAWRTATKKDGNSDRRLVALKEYLVWFKAADPEAETEFKELEKASVGEVAKSFTKFGEALRSGKLTDAEIALAALRKLELGAKKSRVDTLDAVLKDAKQFDTPGASPEELDAIRQRAEGKFLQADDSDLQDVVDFYKSLLTRKIEDLIPKLDDKSAWQNLFDACRIAKSSPWILACQTECAGELKQPNLAVDLSTVTAPPEAACYARYSQALVSADPTVAAKLLAEAFPPDTKPVPALATTYRLTKAIGIFEKAIARWRTGASSGRPFAEATLDAAVAGLTSALNLIDQSGTSIDKGQQSRLRLNLVLALWQKTPRDMARLGTLVEQMVKADEYKLLSPADAYTVLVVHAGAHGSSSSAAQALELVRQNVKLVEPKQVFVDLVQPILDDKIDAPLLAGQDDVQRKTAAARYVATARLIGTNAKAWSQLAEVGKHAPAIVLQLFERAIKLDAQPRYIVWRAFEKIEQGDEPDLNGWRAAADRAVSDLPDFAGGYILQGVVLLNEAAQPGIAREALNTKLKEADKRFEAAGTHAREADEKATALLGRSAALLRLANAATRRSEIDDRLKAAVKHAQDVLDDDKSVALAWDALGLALEDRAMLLGETAEYDNAVNAFVQATGIAFGNYRLKPTLDLGRCLYRRAEKSKDLTQLNQAASELGEVAKLAKAPAYIVEANNFLAKTFAKRAELQRTANPTAAQQALKDARSAYEAAEQMAAAQVPLWLESVLFDHAMLELDLVMARIIALPRDKRATAAKDDKLVAAALTKAIELGGRLKSSSPAGSALLVGKAMLLKVDPDLNTAKRNALAAFADGLEKARPQDLRLRLDLLRERIGLLDPAREAAALANDSLAAYELMTQIEDTENNRVDMLIKAAVSKRAVFMVTATPENRQEYLRLLKLAIQEFPKNGNIWLWQYYIAEELGKGTPAEKTEALNLLDQSKQKAPAANKDAIDTLIRSIKSGT